MIRKGSKHFRQSFCTVFVNLDAGVLLGVKVLWWFLLAVKDCRKGLL